MATKPNKIKKLTLQEQRDKTEAEIAKLKTELQSAWDMAVDNPDTGLDRVDALSGQISRLENLLRVVDERIAADEQRYREELKAKAIAASRADREHALRLFNEIISEHAPAADKAMRNAVEALERLRDAGAVASCIGRRGLSALHPMDTTRLGDKFAVVLPRLELSSAEIQAVIARYFEIMLGAIGQSRFVEIDPHLRRLSANLESACRMDLHAVRDALVEVAA